MQHNADPADNTSKKQTSIFAPFFVSNKGLDANTMNKLKEAQTSAPDCLIYAPMIVSNQSEEPSKNTCSIL